MSNSKNQSILIWYLDTVSIKHCDRCKKNIFPMPEQLKNLVNRHVL